MLLQPLGHLSASALLGLSRPTIIAVIYAALHSGRVQPVRDGFEIALGDSSPFGRRVAPSSSPLASCRTRAKGLASTRFPDVRLQPLRRIAASALLGLSRLTVTAVIYAALHSGCVQPVRDGFEIARSDSSPFGRRVAPSSSPLASCRTFDTGLPSTRFPDVRLQPLGRIAACALRWLSRLTVMPVASITLHSGRVQPVRDGFEIAWSDSSPLGRRFAPFSSPLAGNWIFECATRPAVCGAGFGGSGQAEASSAFSLTSSTASAALATGAAAALAAAVAVAPVLVLRPISL